MKPGAKPQGSKHSFLSLLVDKTGWDRVSAKKKFSSPRKLKNDFNEWPINYDSLEKYYEKCEEVMNISHFNDEISTELGISKNITNKDKL